MALVTSGADDVISLRLWIPRIGVWTADVLFNDATPRTGKLTVQVGALQFVGTVGRGGDFEDIARVRLVGGAAGMNKAATRRQYDGPSVGLVARSLVSTAGETLSPQSDQGILGSLLPSWTTSSEPIGVVLTALLQSLGGGAVWRVLPDGTVWIGRDTWPDASIDPETYEVMDRRFEDGSLMATVSAAAAAVLLPGTTFEAQRVSLVVHNIDDQGEGPYMRVWFADADEGTLEDRLGAAFERAVRAAGPPPVDYRANYRARVVAQVGTDVHVEPELGTMPDMGKIPLLTGLPGLTMTGLAGGSVLVGWRGGDRAKAYAIGFDPDNQVETMLIRVIAQLVLGDTAGAEPFMKTVSFGTAWVALAGAFTAYMAAIKAIADPSGAATTTMTAALTAFTTALAKCATLKVSGS